MDNWKVGEADRYEVNSRAGLSELEPYDFNFRERAIDSSRKFSRRADVRQFSLTLTRARNVT